MFCARIDRLQELREVLIIKFEWNLQVEHATFVFFGLLQPVFNDGVLFDFR